MKLYLSSYKLGKETAKLRELAHGKKIGFIPNAVDNIEPEAWNESNQRNMNDLAELGIAVEMLDLREYFGKAQQLESRLEKLGGVWVRGGNTFILRQAMRLSGLDELLQRKVDEEFFYGGYSAGICVLAPDLRGLQTVDKPTVMPYAEMRDVIWEGIGILEYLILPHYKSDHPESADIDKEVDFCTRNSIPFKTLRDGEVIVIE